VVEKRIGTDERRFVINSISKTGLLTKTQRSFDDLKLR